MKTADTITLFGFASGIAANNPHCALGPWYLYYHPVLFAKLNRPIHWQPMVISTSLKQGADVLPQCVENTTELGRAVFPLAVNRHPFCVIGGDHSSAIGTWSAVAHAHRLQGDIGLIWIDAHMDAHTPDTSHSDNIHGMPVAHLLGEGSPLLSCLFYQNPKIKPENLCLIGIRSYQPDEAVFLARMGVRIYYIEEVQQRGIDDVLAEAFAQVSKTTCGVGISIDLDGIDPMDAPGVGAPEPGGINGAALVRALSIQVETQRVLGLEIAEYNPIRDVDGKTAALLVALIASVYS